MQRGGVERELLACYGGGQITKFQGSKGLFLTKARPNILEVLSRDTITGVEVRRSPSLSALCKLWPLP